MTDDDAYEAHRDQRDMGPPHHSEPDAPAYDDDTVAVPFESLRDVVEGRLR